VKLFGAVICSADHLRNMHNQSFINILRIVKTGPENDQPALYD
jgi:hypothetical protein